MIKWKIHSVLHSKLFIKLLLIIIGVLLIIILSKIVNIDVETKNKVKYLQDQTFITFYVDKDTCVEYVSTSSSYTDILPLYGLDGKVKLNKTCLNNK